MRFDDLIKRPAKKQYSLTYTESLQAKLTQELAVKPVPKFTALEWAIMEGGGSLEETKPVAELFDKKTAVPMEWNKGLGITYATGTVPIGDKQITLDVTFSDMEDGVVDIEFMVGGRYGITGAGGTGPVFATVVAACKQFVLEHPNINVLTFTAGEQSRARMYDTIAKRVSKEMGWHVVPYNDVMSDPKYADAAHTGSFIFVIEKGIAPPSRQAAQKPQHGEFMPNFFVYAYENPDLPAIKLSTKSRAAAEEWVIKNIPGYDKEHPMSIFATQDKPKDRKIIDKGTVK